MELQLPDTVFSRQDIKAVVNELRAYARWQAQAAVKKKVAGDATAKPPELSPSAAELLEALGKKQEISRKSLDGLIGALEQYEASAPRLTITLAAPAPAGLKQQLTGWCRKNIAPGVLVDFKFNSTILGGMVISYGSHTFDWSFRRQVLANRNKFPEVLRNV